LIDSDLAMAEMYIPTQYNAYQLLHRPSTKHFLLLIEIVYGAAGMAEDGQSRKLIGGSDSRRRGPLFQAERPYGAIYKDGEKPSDNLFVEVYLSLLPPKATWDRLTCPSHL
jgi:hypothetical protein